MGYSEVVQRLFEKMTFVLVDTQALGMAAAAAALPPCAAAVAMKTPAVTAMAGA